MGMLIRRHRDRHETEAAVVESEGEGATRAQLKDEAKALGLSTRGNKAELSERIAAHRASEGVDHDVEADKAPDTEPDPGAGGDNPAAPAPEDGAGTDADQLTESGSDTGE